MRRILRSIIAVALLAGVAAIASPADAGLGRGLFTKERHEATDARFSRDFYVYDPAPRPAGTVPLVVYLHGCNQDARQAAVGTRWNELADRRGFVVAYPEQSLPEHPMERTQGSLDGSANGVRCWNWFRPEHHARGGGELASIVAITRRVIAEHKVDPHQVFVVGASAGANMAVNLGATYPDVFAAIGAFAGCAFQACGDETGTLAFEAMGDHARRLPAFVADGTADNLNAYPASEGLAQQWLGTNDLVDNGEADGSVSRMSSDPVTNLGEPPTGEPGDACVRNEQWPCAAGAIGAESYPYTVRTWSDAQGRLVELWTIHGLGHNYPNGDPEGNFTDPHGPDVNAPMYDFFLENAQPPALTVGDVKRNEGDKKTTTFSFRVSLDHAIDAPVTLGFATSDGTAKTASDYVKRSGTLTLSPGSRSATITVAVRGDKKREGNETFTLIVSNVKDATVEKTSGRGTIVDDD